MLPCPITITDDDLFVTSGLDLYRVVLNDPGTRWCGFDFNATKMSTRWTPPAIQGLGIFRREPENQFAGYNQVFAYYCSSDGWLGTREASLLENGGQARAFNIAFNGFRMVEAILDTLQSPLTVSSPDSMLPQYAMPDLEDATGFLLGASSAGTASTRHLSDWMQETLQQRNPGIDLNFGVVVDAGLGPSFEIAFSSSDYDALLDRAAAQRQTYGAVLDASCQTQHAADDPRLCADDTHVIRHHVTAPFFVRQDFQDPVKSPIPYTNGLDFAQAVHDEISALADIIATAEEGALIPAPPGTFGPNCIQHTSLDNRRFFRRNVEQSGTFYSFHDVLWNWWTDSGGPTAVIDTRPTDLSTDSQECEGVPTANEETTLGEVPTAYRLGQNYPNPFTLMTTIRFAMPRSGFARLQVFDVLGRLVETVAEGTLSAGVYTVIWDASHATSGVYFYQLRTDHHAEVKKMILLQ